MFSPTSCLASVMLMAILNKVRRHSQLNFLMNPDFRHIVPCCAGSRFQSLCMFTWKLWGLASMSWMQVFSLDLWTFHNVCQFCMAPDAEPNVSGEDLTPLVVGNDSCWDLRDSRLIFGGFFIQQQRRFRWRRRLTVYMKTDIKGAGTSQMSSGLMAIRISRCVNQHSSGDCLTRAAIPQAKRLYCPQCTRDQDGELVRGCVYFSGLTQSSFICQDQVCAVFLFLLLHFQTKHHLGLSADRRAGSVLFSQRTAATI